ncbi:uncharacterized protein EDB93DRAFT_1100369 [Suillus bovinus]|uniref:uncharacterized protein n=1 Tax=Suillus bovinus TaxID=48563 RepID=UPI001B883AB6|nr:uncharacterized protein EDB93DRAFT_1100369 [Suillus bovinus]KAG2158741.1 hypothetical protein EDB93DRAFT_1100369 [Suillus bovinus]
MCLWCATRPNTQSHRKMKEPFSWMASVTCSWDMKPWFEPDFWSGSPWFGPRFSHQPELDRKMVLGSRSSPMVPFWFGLAEPFQTVIDFDFDCDNFSLHVKLLSSGFALLVNQATFSLFEESCVVKAHIILMEASALEQMTAQPITHHATCAYVDLSSSLALSVHFCVLVHIYDHHTASDTTSTMRKCPTHASKRHQDTKDEKRMRCGTHSCSHAAHVDSTLDEELHVLHAAFIAKNCTVLTSYFHVPPGTSASSAATEAEMVWTRKKPNQTTENSSLWSGSGFEDFAEPDHGPVLGSHPGPSELDRTGPWQHYLGIVGRNEAMGSHASSVHGGCKWEENARWESRV